MADGRDVAIGGLIGLGIAWWLWGRRPKPPAGEIPDIESEIRAYEKLVREGKLSPDDLPVIIDMFAAGAPIETVQAWAGQRIAAFIQGRMLPPGEPVPVEVRIPEISPKQPILPTPEPECYSDIECIEKYGPDWMCLRGVCVYVPTAPPPEEEPIPWGGGGEYP